jgi:hypothetical protein
MTGPARVTIRIGNLRVHGATQAEAQALASALRESLTARLAADPAALVGIGTDRLSVTVPAAQPGHPAALGQAAGQQIATALSVRKGGQR